MIVLDVFFLFFSKYDKYTCTEKYVTKKIYDDQIKTNDD